MCERTKANFYEPESFNPCRDVEQEMDRLGASVEAGGEEASDIKEWIEYRIKTKEARDEDEAKLAIACENIHRHWEEEG